ncbi:MAG: YfbM family protein [Candidatus Methanoplasma sp.]|jgi:hypothetical protein|nr:YfbM family protein [Candidatus Methanoplasma sp.]
MDLQLAEFVRQVREKTDDMCAAEGKATAQMGNELSAYIASQMQELMKQGLTVTEIQDALRLEVDRVEQTYAPDDDLSGECEESTSTVCVTTYLLPMEDSVVAAFATGDMDEKGLTSLICSSPDVASFEMFDGLEHVLTCFGKDPAMNETTGAGDIVAGADGEAYVPEYLEVGDPNGCHHLIFEPAVFKTSAEAESVARLLDPMTEETFFKRADIKKLVKSGWLDGYDRRDVKKEASFIVGELWSEFVLLREVYRKAARQGKGMLIFIGYQPGEDSDSEDDA